MSRLAAVFSFSLLFHSGQRLAAQEAESPAPPHTSVSSIRALDEHRLDAAEPVKLRGTVIYADAGGFSLHDGHFAIQVTPTPEVESPPVGALVLVEGTTGTNRPAGRTYPLVVARSLLQENLAPPPAPLPCSVRDLSSLLHWDQFVVVEGFVIDHSWSDGVHRILLGAHDDWAVIHVQETPEDRFRSDLLGARIRARGINQGPNRSPMQAMKVAAPGVALPDPVVETNATTLRPGDSTELYVRQEGPLRALSYTISLICEINGIPGKPPARKTVLTERKDLRIGNGRDREAAEFSLEMKIPKDARRTCKSVPMKKSGQTLGNSADLVSWFVRIERQVTAKTVLQSDYELFVGSEAA